MARSLCNVRSSARVVCKGRSLKGFLDDPLDAGTKRLFDIGTPLLSQVQATNVDIAMGERPLVLLLPWLGATPRGIAKYEALYKKYDFDVIVHRASLRDFLWPKSGLKSSLRLLNKLCIEARSNAASRPLIIHCFSIGCYFYALLLMQMEMHKENFHDLRSSVIGQVLDSPVLGSLEEMALGVSKMMSHNSAIVSRMYKNLCLWYFYVSNRYTVTYYKQGMHTIFFKAPVVNSLMLLSEDDPLYIPKAAKEVVDSWTLRGTPVSCKTWKNSAHAQHLRFHHDEYIDLMDKFVKGCSNSGRDKYLQSKL